MPPDRTSLPRRLRVHGTLDRAAVGDLLHALHEQAPLLGAPPIILDLRGVSDWDAAALRALERHIHGSPWRGRGAVMLRPSGTAATGRTPATAADLMRPLAASVPVTTALHSVLAMVLDEETELGVIDLSGRMVGHLPRRRLRQRMAEDPEGWRHRLCAALLVEHQGSVRADASIADVEAMSGLPGSDSERPFLVLDGPEPVGFLFPSVIARSGQRP